MAERKEAKEQARVQALEQAKGPEMTEPIAVGTEEAGKHEEMRSMGAVGVTPEEVV